MSADSNGDNQIALDWSRRLIPCLEQFPSLLPLFSRVGMKVSEGHGADTEKESHGADSDSLVAAVWRRTLCGLREGVQQLISNVCLGHRIAAKEPAEQRSSLLNKYKLLLWVVFF